MLPTVLDALREGRITFDHARLIADQADSPNRDNLLEDIEEILGWAVTRADEPSATPWTGWARDLDERREAGMTDHERQLRHRKVRRTRTKEGLRRTILDFDDETDALVYGAVRDIVADMLRAERKAQKAAGDEPGGPPARDPPGHPPDLGRCLRRARPPLPGRRCHHQAQGPPHHPGPHRDVGPLGPTQGQGLLCGLADGTKLTSAQIRRMACEADIIPMVMDTNGVCLDMGDTIRLATYNQRLALRATHATCAVEGCDMDFDWCEIHHLHPWERGGLTDLDNLVPLCSYHHHLIHDCDTEPDVLPNRVLRVVPIPLTPAPQRRRPATCRWEPVHRTLCPPADERAPRLHPPDNRCLP